MARHLRDRAVPAPESAAELAKATTIVREIITVDNVETEANGEEEGEEQGHEDDEVR
eukprot:CAMPEP_0184969912 /NCGR_PEP_ID=MMETSP1098-20130426/2524_1 /TAXON_ID=89044 /ORGANISM="Spumella elongata, Strain CCAP 955/1" /LENGTH=56 /DNA_ID=CAMNT_0027491747 /DNA_START=244 /DNA_END=414 /DNA_ORIENTATION=+